MGRRGPAPEPTAMLNLKNSWRGKYRKGEPKSSGKPKCPNWLTDRERKLWRELVRTLMTMRVLSRGDGQMLSRYCHLWYRWRDMEEFIAQNGVSYDIVMGKEGDEFTIHRKYPQASEAHELSKQLLRMEQEFGLSPASRARVQAQVDQQTENEAQSLLMMDSSYREN